MTKLLNTIDELNRGRNLVKAAYMAVHGIQLEHDELEALTGILGAAEDSLETVKTSLEGMVKSEK